MKKTVLIVEDERPLRNAAEKNLMKAGIDALSASTADAAMDILDSGVGVDAIWLDHYLLGKETGLDFLCDLRSHNLYKDIPVFAVTNSVGDDKVDSYSLLGIEKYFIKSNSSLSEIVAAVKEVIE